VVTVNFDAVTVALVVVGLIAGGGVAGAASVETSDRSVTVVQTPGNTTEIPGGTDNNASNPTPNVTVTPGSTVTSTPSPTATRTPTPSPTPTDTPTATPVEDGTEPYASLDKWVNVTDWSYNDDAEVFVVTFTAEEPNTITAMAGGEREEGVGTGVVTEERLSRGENTIRIPAPAIGGEAMITITSEESIDAGQYVYVSTGVSGESPFEQVSPTYAWFGGASVTLLMGIAAILRRVRGGDDAPEEAW
jgi:hypothetical protein